ncbi:hypothetical protein [Alienimonas sp. DA493]|uniref:hypothetical protein n=1 Tax=Alienimonas sp. DA493 TaxID=3373605 RepID=UPI0037551365
MSDNPIRELLTKTEAERLEACEAAIGRSFAALCDAAAAWKEIRDGRLYRRSFDRFEDYCERKWGFSKTHVNRVIAAGEVAKGLETTPVGAIPLGERHLRELGRLPEDVRVNALSEAAEESDGRPTAEKIREVGARYAPFKATATKPAQPPAKPAAAPQRAAQDAEPWSPPQPGDDDGQFSDDADDLFDGEPEDDDEPDRDYSAVVSKWLSDGEAMVDEIKRCGGEAGVPLPLVETSIRVLREQMGGAG